MLETFPQFFIFNFAFLIGLPLAYALPGVQSSENLKDLAGIGVVVEKLDREYPGTGLTRQGLEGEVKARLRLAGIRVLGTTAREKIPGAPFLYVNVMVDRIRDLPVFLFVVRVEVQETVRSLRPAEHQHVAVIWRERSAVGTIGEDYVHDIFGVIQSQVDKFIEAYQAENPPRPK